MKHLDWKRIGWTAAVLILCFVPCILSFVEWWWSFVYVASFITSLFIGDFILKVTKAPESARLKSFYYHNGEEEK